MRHRVDAHWFVSPPRLASKTQSLIGLPVSGIRRPIGRARVVFIGGLPRRSRKSGPCDSAGQTLGNLLTSYIRPQASRNLVVWSFVRTRQHRLIRNTVTRINYMHINWASYCKIFYSDSCADRKIFAHCECSKLRILKRPSLLPYLTRHLFYIRFAAI